MPITTIVVPTRNMSVNEFDSKSDAFFGQLPAFGEELSALEAAVLTTRGEVETLVAEANVAANSAISASNAEKWVTGTIYTEGEKAWSPLDGLTYRAKTNLTSTTDPSLDPTNWWCITTVVFNYATVSKVVLRDVGYTFVDRGNSGTAAQTIDVAAGTHQRIKATGSFTIAFSNWPASGNTGEVLLELVADGTARSITFPSGTKFLKFDGSTTTIFSETSISLQSTDGAVDWIYFWTRDEGTTLYCKVVR